MACVPSGIASFRAVGGPGLIARVVGIHRFALRHRRLSITDLRFARPGMPIGALQELFYPPGTHPVRYKLIQIHT